MRVYNCFLCFLLVVFCTGYSNSENITGDATPYIFEEAVVDLLECFRKVLTNGIPNLGIPHLNPAYLDDIDKDFDTNLIKGKFSATNVTVGGIPDFEVLEIKILTKFSYSFAFNVTLKCNYVFDGLLGDYEQVHGDGELELNGGYQFDGVFKLVVGSGNSIKDLNTTTIIKPILKLTGLHADEDISDIASSAITQIMEAYLNVNMEQINLIIAQQIQDTLNAILKIEVTQEIAALLTEIVLVCS